MRQRFIQSFSTSGDVQTAVDNNELGKPYVAYVEDGQYIDWNTRGIDYASMPLTFEIISGGTIVWKAKNTAYTTTIEYSKDNGETWTSITSTTGGTSISVNAGDVVQFRGDNATYSSGDSYYNTFKYSTAKFEVEGNIMSLIDSTGFTTATTLASSYTFYYLFTGTYVISAENLVLPASTLADYCYHYMFAECTSLTTAPKKLPATTLAQYCYYQMFGGCQYLTTTPELPATTLANNCYNRMFSGCKYSLRTAPALPATTLANNCYQSMFTSCWSLTSAPELPATTLANGCYDSMFADCESLTSAPELPATILTKFCYRSMFYDCTSLTQAPELNATTLASDCYYQMFSSCESLNYIKCLATDISATSCTNGWVNGVAPTGTFVKAASMTGWTTGKDGIPTGWTVIDAEV